MNPDPEEDESLDLSDANINVDMEQPPYFWTADPEEQRRAFIFEHMASPDIDGKILVENMNMAAEWLKSGAMPKLEPVRGRKA